MKGVEPGRSEHQTRDREKRPVQPKSKATSELGPQPAPVSKSRANSTPKPKSKPTSNPSTKPQAKLSSAARSKKKPSKSTEGWFEIRDIIDEKQEHGCTLYLVDWDGTDKNDEPYEPTWQLAEYVTGAAIAAWEEKKSAQVPVQEQGVVQEQGPEQGPDPGPDPDSASTQAPAPDSSGATNAPVHSQHSSLLPESTQQSGSLWSPDGNPDINTPLKRRWSESALASSSGDAAEEVRKRRRIEQPSASSTPARRASPGGRLTEDSRRADASIPQRRVAGNQERQIVVELPSVLTLDPSEFQVVPPSQSQSQSQSQSGQALSLSQATLVERMRPSSSEARDERIVPDSQEISGTSISEAHSSYQRRLVSLGNSQLPEDLSASSLRELPSSSGIPSRQVDSQFAGVSSFLANPNLSTNQNQTVPQTTPTGPSQQPADESGPAFQTQLEPDVDIFAVSSPTAASHGTTIPASFPQHPSRPTSQDANSQLSHIAGGGSSQDVSQAAQIVRPLVSHPTEPISQSQSDFSLFEEDRTAPGIVPSDGEHRTHRQGIESAPNEFNGNTGISTASEESQSPSSAARPGESQLALPSRDHPDPRGAVDISQARPTTSIDPIEMDGAPEAQMPLSMKERLRLHREQSFKKSTVPVSASPAAPPAEPLQNVQPAADKKTSPPRAESHGETASFSATGVPPIVSPMLPLSSEAPQMLAGPSSEPGPADIDHSLPHQPVLVDPSSLNSYHAPQVEQPATLDPSTLTLSIEKDVEGSPSIATDNESPSEPSKSANLDEDEMPASYPRSLLPEVPTAPCEYLVTLPFQASTRPQYNDIIRENNALMNEYNASFQSLPHSTPSDDVVERLDAMFNSLLDICDFPPFLDSLTSMSPLQITKHAIGTNAKFYFLAELFNKLVALESNKKVLILVRPGKLIDLLDSMIRSAGCRYYRSEQEIVKAADAKHPLTVILSSTSDDEPVISMDIDVVIAFDHTFQQKMVPAIHRKTPPVTLQLVTVNSIQHLNMRIKDNLHPLERKNVLMLALVKAMRHVEEPDSSDSLDAAADKFAGRIQMVEEDDDFYWEPQTIPSDVFGDLYADSSQIETTQPSGQGLSVDEDFSTRKRSHDADDEDENTRKKPKISQPPVVTTSNPIGDAIRNLFENDFTHGSEKGTIVVSVERLQALADKFAELESSRNESKARESEFRQLSDRAQAEVVGYVKFVNTCQRKYMDALKDRGIFEADCKVAEEKARVLTDSVETFKTDVKKLKATKMGLEKKLVEANNALLNSSNPDLVKMAELETNLNTANATIKRLETEMTLVKSDLAYRDERYQDASKRAGELAAENRVYEQKIQDLQRKADDNVVEVNKVQARSEAKVLAGQILEQRAINRDQIAENNRLREELRTLREGRRGTRQSSVPRSPRPNSLGVMSPRNGGTRVPSAMGGPSSSRGTSPQPPVALFDSSAGPGNTGPNSALFNQPGRFAHLRDPRY
ncbi:hypothetical protein F4777DRAFT_415945 [Nemania sp. FL0916]|nr:hypothetical protein F4777DRAFT_415945 [Nemania sp. FL0916]